MENKNNHSIVNFFVKGVDLAKITDLQHNLQTFL